MSGILRSLGDEVEVAADPFGLGGQERGSQLQAWARGQFGRDERVALLAGHFDITSPPGAGTTIAVQLPVQRVDPPRAAPWVASGDVPVIGESETRRGPANASPLFTTDRRSGG